MDSYLKLIEQIGEGAFSKLYSAYDFRLNKQVALKIEKNNNKKTLLKTEFEIYKSLQNLPCIPKIYNYIKNITNEKDENKQLNCLEMELLGKNLSLFKKKFSYYNNILAYDILFQCLNCIQKIHNYGIIHRDIKPSNFCLNKEDEKKIILNYKNNIYFKHDINVYLIDFGLIKKINEKEIIETKKKCIDEPEKYLFLTNTKNNEEIINIFNYIKNLKSNDEPDYEYIFRQLSILKNKEIKKIYYNYEVKNQILNLQKNLMIKNTNQNYNKIEPNNKPLYNLSDQDYIISKLGANSKSIPSLNSTNYTSSIYYKTNYINCISGNNNENFYQSVLKTGNCNNSKTCKNYNNIMINNKKYYNMNNNVNILPYKYKDMEEKYENKNNINNNNENAIDRGTLKSDKKYENDKSLIEFLIGNSRKESPRKDKNKLYKKEKKTKNKKLNLHNKRKKIKFSIIKKEK